MLPPSRTTEIPNLKWIASFLSLLGLKTNDHTNQIQTMQWMQYRSQAHALYLEFARLLLSAWNSPKENHCLSSTYKLYSVY